MYTAARVYPWSRIRRAGQTRPVWLGCRLSMSPSVQVAGHPGPKLELRVLARSSSTFKVYAAEQARPASEEPDSCFALRLAARLARSPSDTPRARPGCASSCRVSLHCHSMKPTCSCHTRLCRGLTSNSKVTRELRSPKDRRAEPFTHYRVRLGLYRATTRTRKRANQRT